MNVKVISDELWERMKKENERVIGEGGKDKTWIMTGGDREVLEELFKLEKERLEEFVSKYRKEYCEVFGEGYDFWDFGCLVCVDEVPDMWKKCRSICRIGGLRKLYEFGEEVWRGFIEEVKVEDRERVKEDEGKVKVIEEEKVKEAKKRVEREGKEAKGRIKSGYRYGLIRKEILNVLREDGGIRSCVLVRKVGERLKEIWNEEDFERIKGGKELVWQNKVRWEIYRLCKEGKIKREGIFFVIS